MKVTDMLNLAKAGITASDIYTLNKAGFTAEIIEDLSKDTSNSVEEVKEKIEEEEQKKTEEEEKKKADAEELDKLRNENETLNKQLEELQGLNRGKDSSDSSEQVSDKDIIDTIKHMI